MKRLGISYKVIVLRVVIIMAIVFVEYQFVSRVLFQSEAKQQEEGPGPIERDTAIIEQAVLEMADDLAAGYNYDNAIGLLQNIEGYEDEPVYLERIRRYEAAKQELVLYEDIETIPHIFFHSLIVDNEKAFDGDENADGYNQVMTTISEFQKIMQQMYERGYVLISIHDMVSYEVDESGGEVARRGEIWLPEGKKPFVLSIDDVSYYEYMEGDGFASRIVLDENGWPTCEMDQDGSMVRGDFDVVPCLETFIQEHPDFSYRGARGILALTGYNGVLGYRTDPSYAGREEYPDEVAKAKEVAEGLKKHGWEFASHSYGHLDYGRISYEQVQKDAGKWQDTVASIVGDTDILIYPYGADIGDWTGYSGEKYDFLQSMGFRYYCNVDGARYWVRIEENYMRQGRRNLDGVRMYYDLIDENTDFLSDLFNVREVFDFTRPLPVPEL